MEAVNRQMHSHTELMSIGKQACAKQMDGHERFLNVNRLIGKEK